MPIWAISLIETLAKAMLPIIWQALVKAGVISKTQAELVKAGVHIITTVESVKTYPDYTGTEDDPLPEVTTNLTTNDGSKIGV